jgi:hypothetical protein
MNDAWSRDRADWLEFHLARVEMFEEPRAAAEQKRNDMNLQFVE